METPKTEKSGNFCHKEEVHLNNSGRRIYSTVHVKLQKSFSVQVAHEGLETVFKDAPKQVAYELFSSTKRKEEWQQWEAPYSRECRLPSADLTYFLVRFTAQICNAVNSLIRFCLWCSPHKHQLYCQGSPAEQQVWTWGPGSEGMGTQGVFSSTLQVRGKGLRSREDKWAVSAGPQPAACFVRIKKFCFYDQGILTNVEESRVNKR